jgi:proline dehydrogenase
MEGHPPVIRPHTGPLRRVAGSAWHTLAGLAARPYLAGESLQEALEAYLRLQRQGVRTALGYWNTLNESPREVTDAYLAALRAIPDPEGACLSLKAPALRFEPMLLDEIVACARSRGVRLHFDSHGLDAADATFSCVKQAALSGVRSGCTLPARWQRSGQDAERAVKLRVPVRVVKGQWSDPGFTENPREAFVSLIRRLAGRASHVGVATHDEEVAQESLRLLQRQKTPCEMELLFGLPMTRMVAMAREMEVPVRVYVPYGCGWLPYALSQARRNPRIVWWMMRDLVRGRAFSLPAA